jgi:putative SOS response-associated peptidase YedK
VPKSGLLAGSFLQGTKRHVRTLHRSLFVARDQRALRPHDALSRSTFPPRYNVAPTQQSFVVRLAKDGGRELAELKWGLVPSWSKDDTGAARMINARAETVARQPAFRAAFKARPCLVVADGFYEWKKLDSGKQPYFITRRGGKPFAFAGLWEWWRPKDAPTESAGLETFTILTTGPNALCAQIHNRMPLMLAPDDFAGWLATPDDRAARLRPFPAPDMEMWPITVAVGNVKNTGPELIEPIGAPIEGVELV